VKSPDPSFQQALDNGYLANEGYVRCLNFVNDWLEYADPETGLIPRNLHDNKDIWNAKDAAADNYPFMVLTAYMLDKDLYEGRMQSILETEQELTNRVDRLPDTYSFSKRGFEDKEIDMDRIIFGASEYVKDGLLPLTEYIGHTPWSERMIGIIDDIWKNALHKTDWGMIPSLNVEVNGEMLQALSRVYWMTGDDKYLDWAIRLGDYYLLGDQHPTKHLQVLRLRDHGCEIISGLCELYVTVSFAKREKKEVYKEPVYAMLDRILEAGRNEHGLFYNQINPVTGEILNNGIADTWGYTCNAYYSVYMLDGHEPYRDAVIQSMKNLDFYRNYDWERGSSDGYADAVESALNLFNREQVEGVDEWIESQIKIMWSMQDSAHREGTEKFRGTGVIEGWHGDGNFARTTIMFCLWKTQGITIEPWDEELVYGAVNDNGVIKLALKSDSGYIGKIQFDKQRHKEIFRLPVDYPRINQFPEWLVVKEEANYEVTRSDEKKAHICCGSDLLNGINISIRSGDKIYIEIKEM